MTDDLREKCARALYEADHESGFDLSDPTTYWRAGGYSDAVWDNWLRIADAILSIAIPAIREEAALVAERMSYYADNSADFDDACDKIRDAIRALGEKQG